MSTKVYVFAAGTIAADAWNCLPDLELTCTTANYGRARPVTNYLFLEWGNNNLTAAQRRKLNSLSNLDAPPTFSIWDTQRWTISQQEAAGYIELPAYDIPVQPFPAANEEIVTKRPRLMAPNEKPPTNSEPVADAQPGPSTASN